jgi:hypothetical protein
MSVKNVCRRTDTLFASAEDSALKLIHLVAALPRCVPYTDARSNP